MSSKNDLRLSTFHQKDQPVSDLACTSMPTTHFLAASDLNCIKLSLHKAIEIAVSENKVIRRDADFVVNTSSLLQLPTQVSSTLDPAIRDSGFLFGQRGRAAALSDFDTRFQVSTIWGRNEAIQNSRFLSGGILPGQALVEETADFNASVSRNLRSGGQARLFHTWNYDGSNRDDLLFQSVYRGTVGAEVRQPFLAGSGRLYTDVAGPPGDSINGVTGVSQGILISKNETALEQIELTKSVAELIKEVEIIYWKLAFASSSLEQAESLVETLCEYGDALRARRIAGADTGNVEVLAGEVLQLDAQMLEEELITEVSSLNHRLMRLLSLPISGRATIVPSDRACTAKVVLDKKQVTDVACSRRPEIRQQQLRIRGIDYQIRAAQSLLLPQLDGIARYQVNGFGDHLIAEPTPGPSETVQSAYGNLFQGDHTGWQLGFQFSHTFGRRLERTRLRNLRLQSQKQRIILQEQIIDIGHEISLLDESLDSAYSAVELATKKVGFAKKRLETVALRNRADENSSSLLAVADGTKSFVISQIELNCAQSKYAQTLARVQHATGGLFHEQFILASGT